MVPPITDNMSTNLADLSCININNQQTLGKLEVSKYILMNCRVLLFLQFWYSYYGGMYILYSTNSTDHFIKNWTLSPGLVLCFWLIRLIRFFDWLIWLVKQSPV